MKITLVLSKFPRLVFVTIATLALTFSPVPVVFADSTAECVPPAQSAPGVRVPTGSDSGMFVYNCEQQLWLSTHYAYDPATDTTAPLDPIIYTYNTATAAWDYDKWMYIASKGDYALRTFSVATPPVGAITVGGPLPDVSQESSNSLPSNSNAAHAANGGVQTFADTSNGTATAIAVANNIGSIATTGNATVFGNTTAGSASTGNASAVATLVNMLQSTGNVFGATGNAAVFNTTISGDVTGDILLDPTLISSFQPSNAPANSMTGIEGVNNTTSASSVTNELSVAAVSGDALVAANTNAGNATSGSATAIANVLNFLNSTVLSGKSFIGIINIEGNLNGDILLPPQFIDELLASNVPTVAVSAPMDSSGKINTSVSQSITNAVVATAQTGEASVSKNTAAGNADTGNAMTNVTTFNLTGSSVVGKNALLVFVNVLGTWYGLIFNAPTGATAATLGGNISSSSSALPVGSINTETNQVIQNTIVASAETGDATVTKNTTAGDAKTGNAKAAVNILNVAHSVLSLSDWFGILFINVLGSWTGSFGVDTIAGTVTGSDATTPQMNNAASIAASEQPALFRFIPRATTAASLFSSSSTPTGESEETTLNLSDASVLAAQQITPGGDSPAGADKNETTTYWIYAGFIGIWVILMAAERIYAKLHNAK